MTDYTEADILRGQTEELKEHGDVINNDPAKARRIAIEHLGERGDYYDALDFVEQQPKGIFRFKDQLVLVNTIILFAIVVILVIFSIYIIVIVPTKKIEFHRLTQPKRSSNAHVK